jgi:hypothetical protein
MKNRDLFTFLALTFGIGWLCMGLAYIQGFHSAGRLWVLPAMWSPFAGALLASRQTRSIWSAALAHSSNNVVLGCMIVLPNGWLVDQWTAITVRRASISERQKA